MHVLKCSGNVQVNNLAIIQIKYFWGKCALFKNITFTVGVAGESSGSSTYYR